MAKWIKEPFIQFLLLGAFIFLLYHLAGGRASGTKNEIQLDEQNINQMIISWQRQWDRPPTEKELGDLINEAIRQEILYREALRLNLDNNDEIIKRRLAQKMEFLSSDLASASLPNDSQLLAFYKNHENRYLLPNQFEFYQLFFSPDKRKDAAQDATKTLNQISDKTSPQSCEGLGDESFYPFYQAITLSTSLEAKYGTNFPNQLEALPIGKWAGPVTSGYGQHLIFIVRRVAPQMSAFNVVKDKVIQDYQLDMEQQFNDSLYRKMRAGYSVLLNLGDQQLKKRLIDSLKLN